MPGGECGEEVSSKRLVEKLEGIRMDTKMLVDNVPYLSRAIRGELAQMQIEVARLRSVIHDTMTQETIPASLVGDVEIIQRKWTQLSARMGDFDLWMPIDL